MSKLRLKISMSLDGFVAGSEQSVDNPLGIGGMRLHEWVFPLAAWRSMHGMPGGEANESTRVVEESLANIGATVMGRNMFGGHPGPWDSKKPWNGWWGPNPPYHHPVFVLTHHARDPLTLEGRAAVPRGRPRGRDGDQPGADASRRRRAAVREHRRRSARPHAGADDRR